jgi:alcohol dehydrogenase (cytochrome c)
VTRLLRASLAVAVGLLLPMVPASAVDGQKATRGSGASWSTYHGDYSGRRFSTLSQINAGNVKNLALSWIYRLNLSATDAVTGGLGGDVEVMDTGEPLAIKATPLMADGILYLSVPDHVWAVDARTGQEIWHYRWRTSGGFHYGNRGVGLFKDWLYVETPDNYLVSLDAKTGRERWHRQFASINQQYYSSMAPLVIRNHVIVGVGGDLLDVPGFLESRDPDTGEVQWRWWSTPRPGEPGAETWPTREAMEHGGGMTWLPPSYDPELNLIYLGTGNPNPVMAGQSRRGDNLWTCSIVALNPDTGKLAWYFQTSPHDTHDWDAAQTPVLFDGEFKGRPRRLLAQANRNGLFFLLDRATGEHLLTAKLIESANWYTRIGANGQPIPAAEKEPGVMGVLVSPDAGGATNWWPYSFNPDTGLFYVGTSQSFAIFYKTDTDERPEGFGGTDRGVGHVGKSLRAIDYRTGRIAWQRETAIGSQGLLSTAGKLLFGSDGWGNFIAFDPASGSPLWHARLLDNPSNAPITFMLDGRQVIVVGAGDCVYAFSINP